MLAADFADGGAAALAQRLRQADPRVLVVVVDKEHLGRRAASRRSCPLKANAYVANPTKRELVDKLQHLVAQQRAARRRRSAAPRSSSRARPPRAAS